MESPVESTGKRLVLRVAWNRQERSVVLKDGTTIGSDSANDLQVTDSAIRSSHGYVEEIASGFHLVSKPTADFTLADGCHATTVWLWRGRRFYIGSVAFLCDEESVPVANAAVPVMPIPKRAPERIACP